MKANFIVGITVYHKLGNISCHVGPPYRHCTLLQGLLYSHVCVMNLQEHSHDKELECRDDLDGILSHC